MRTCKKCGETKPVDDFPPTGSGTKRHECRQCQRARYQAYYRENPPYYKEKGAKYYRTRRKALLTRPEYLAKRKEQYKRHNAAKRAKVLDHYGRACACCGETIERFLTIDHVNGDGHLRRHEHASGLGFYRWLIRNRFPADFQTLCFNCNLGRALNGGLCPHKEGSTTIPKGSRAKRPEAPSPR